MISNTSKVLKNFVDSHQHFWEYDEQQYPWIQQGWRIRRSYLPADLKPLLRDTGFDGCVAVQARQSIEETRWLLGLAEQNRFIAGVVGWVDLRSPDVGEQLLEISHPKLVGVRHVAQDEPDDRFLVGEEFVRGIGRLKDFDLAYDLLVYPRQLSAAMELVRMFPQQRFVLDHIGKPNIRDQQLEPWRTQIQALAREPNVYCKLSGMVAEAKWDDWRPSDFRSYLDVVWEAFGEDRLMIGSDWPVCLLSSEYDVVIGLIEEYLSEFPSSAQEKIYGENATHFYKLKFNVGPR
jgi:L-fuconolactonase